VDNVDVPVADVLLLGVVPAIAACIIIVKSVRSMVSAPGVIQFCLGLPIVLLSLVSLWILKQMFFDFVWPTYLPYYAIALTVPLVVIQRSLARTRKNRAFRGDVP
jgi:hypothetical protein